MIVKGTKPLSVLCQCGTKAEQFWELSIQRFLWELYATFQTTSHYKEHWLGICAFTTLSEVSTLFPWIFLSENISIPRHTLVWKASFSFAVFQVHFYSETFCFAYDSCIDTAKQERKKSENWVWYGHFWPMRKLCYVSVLYGCTIHPLDSLHLENESNLVITGQ